MLLTNGVSAVRAGSSDPTYHPPTELPQIRVPRPRSPEERERVLLELYERALAVLHSEVGAHVVPVFAAIHAELQLHFKDDWLLRWNLLESLLKLRFDGALSKTLKAELEALEIRFEYRQPIATGLRYLAASGGLGGG